jgi:uncharacterized damage-inducible protein DinB
MPGLVAPVADERSALLAFLAQQRYVLRLAAYGLTDDQARATPTAGALSIGGLLKHVARVEDGWIDLVLERPSAQDPEAYQRAFRLDADESLATVLDRYQTVAQRTEAVIGAIPDLTQPVHVPPDVPWFPDDVEAWSVRWVLLHLIQETARHAGHADIVRESLDGATAYPIMAAAEGWPATPWLQPWKPAP